ncbi:sugar transferase [Nitratireductor luteus]|uniref:sugar transferase n=1 Tax=Nitratireductor luteus TaxID=2976980 RepID=UPI00223F7E51|nr:sugar transferase [Nitratireductor luteus]
MSTVDISSLSFDSGAHRGKRAFDLVLSVPGLILATPVILVTGLLVWATSRGPAIYSQMRIGRGGKPFRCYKLRTMHIDTPSVPTHETQKHAITGVGRFLRRTKLDELPQLWNVVKGEMSLVGPRPCLVTQTDLIAHRERLGVFSGRPGITGLAQLRGIDMSRPALCAKSDAEYLANWTLSGDIALIIRTAFPRL